MFRISGGNDKQGFPMKQGVLSANRVRLLLHKGVSCYRPRRRGERKRKSVRGCIVASDLAVLNLVVTKKGEHDIPGLTDAPVPRRLGPKRANNIRKLFNLGKVGRRMGWLLMRLPVSWLARCWIDLCFLGWLTTVCNGGAFHPGRCIPHPWEYTAPGGEWFRARNVTGGVMVTVNLRCIDWFEVAVVGYGALLWMIWSGWSGAL